MKWVRATVLVRFPMNFFDNKEVLRVVLMTGECGEKYIRTKPGGVKEPKEMTQDLVAAVFSDG